MQVEDYNITEEELEAEYDSIPDSSFRIFCEYFGMMIGVFGIVYLNYFAHGGAL